MASQPARKLGKFSYADYLRWPAEERWEMIDGEASAMSPSPSELHQRTVGRLFARFFAFFDGHACRVYAAPFDVVLTQQDVVQPDVLVVCDRSKITASHIEGAPDLVVEVTSPSTAARDRREKFQLYERHGVREYVVVHPEEQFVESFLLGADGRFGRPAIFAANETWRSGAFEALEVDLSRVFAE